MAKRRVVLQEPISLTGNYAQPERYAIPVGDAKTAVVILDVYAATAAPTGVAAVNIETASRTDPAPYTEPGSMWVIPTGMTFTVASGTTGAAIASTETLGDVLRFTVTSWSGLTGLDFSITVWLIDD